MWPEKAGDETNRPLIGGRQVEPGCSLRDYLFAATTQCSGGRAVRCSDMDDRGQKCSQSAPRYIPGYTGHCPQLKFHIGKSYGKLIREYLKETHSNCHHVLSEEPSPSYSYISGDDPNRKIPGFTGFIPSCKERISYSYSTMCQKALTEFHQEMRERTLKRSVNLPLVGSQQLDRPKPSLNTIFSSVPYKSLDGFIPPRSPYEMDKDDPRKYFMSGFSGHVPRSRFLFGEGYPAITNKALIDYEQMQ